MVIELLVWLLNCSVGIELLCGYSINKKKKLGFVNIVNTNDFFIPMKNCPKVTLIWVLTVQHLNTETRFRFPPVRDMDNKECV